MSEALRVAVAQVAPVWLDREATLQKWWLSVRPWYPATRSGLS
jgi:predicted amidohydrolase